MVHKDTFENLNEILIGIFIYLSFIVEIISDANSEGSKTTITPAEAKGFHASLSHFGELPRMLTAGHGCCVR